MLDGSGNPIRGVVNPTDPSAMARSGSITPAFKPVGVIDPPSVPKGPSPVTMSSSSYPGLGPKMAGPVPPADGGFWKASYNASPSSIAGTPDAGRRASVAGGLNTLKNFIAAPFIGTAATYAIPAYIAGRAATQLVGGVSDAMSGRPNPITSASNEARQQTYDAFRSGDYGRAAGAGVRAMGQTAAAMGRDALTPFGSFLGGVFNSSAAPASAAPAAAPPAMPPPPDTPQTVMPSAAQPSGPLTVQPATQGQSLSQLYPDRFKGVPKFGDVVAGGAGNGRTPLTTQEKNYNAQILRGLELENRARELENVDRYRAVQLKDRSALAALQATREGGVGQQLAREQLDPEGRTDAMQQKLGQLDERASAVTNALFDPSTPSSEGRINRARQLQQRLNAAREAFGLPAQTLEEMVQSSYGRTYDPKSGYFKQPK